MTAIEIVALAFMLTVVVLLLVSLQLLGEAVRWLQILNDTLNALRRYVPPQE